VNSVHARRLRFAALVAAALAPACGSEAPLGGPFGGSGIKIGPTDGRGIDGGTYTPPMPPPPVAGGEPNTWTHIFGSYLQTGTPGNCGECHAEFKSSTGAYNYLRDLEYVGTTPPPLTDIGQSCLAWFGGTMPPGVVPKNDALVAELTTWAKNGGKND
jgi:hypothetical protein